jgi:diaminohydroxyphosphoribosylaminopyrimidine deaminase/5-amino-6-(5-phosphoribosylamino)uracil reductase
MTSLFMRQALALARRGTGRTHPNPRVGAVVVRNGEIVGRGYHHRVGSPHAEVLALREAGEQARGATLYVTLEPCRHTGRTPPCTDAILAAGVAAVVIALPDPNPVAGGGGEQLAAQGVEVSWGDGAEAALALNLPFLSWVVRRRPWVTLKAALSADGHVATATGQSQYLTGPTARQHVHRHRNRIDAVVVGSGTVLADDPLLTTRGVRGGRDPVRVVLDSRGRLPASARVLNPASSSPTLVYTTEETPVSYERAIFSAGGEVVRVDGEQGHVALTEVLADLGERGLLDILVEGGPTVHGAFLRAGLVDAVQLYLAPKLLGGDALPVIGGPGARSLDDSWLLTPPRIRALGADVLYEAYMAVSWEEMAARCLPGWSKQPVGSRT